MTATEIKSTIDQTGKSVNAIEKELKMPQGTLGKAINGKRALPGKWDKLLKNLLKKEIKTLADAVESFNSLPAILMPGTVTKKDLEEVIEDVKKIMPAIQPCLTIEKKEPIELIANPTEWVTNLENFCNTHNCTPQDLMDHYSPAQIKKPDASLAELLPKQSKAETYFEKRQREAIGN